MTKGPCWRALEANPDVISEYSKSIGGPSNVHFCDVLSTEDWALEMTPAPVLALLLVYPITKASESFSKSLQEENRKECETNEGKRKALNQIWFTKQTVGNACGTVALLHVFGNLELYELTPGGYLDEFYKKSSSLTPDERAIALETDDSIMAAHTAAESGGQVSCQ